MILLPLYYTTSIPTKILEKEFPSRWNILVNLLKSFVHTTKALFINDVIHCITIHIILYNFGIREVGTLTLSPP